MIRYHHDIDQQTDAWFAVRLGILTASEMKRIITPEAIANAANGKKRTQKDADKEISHMYELLAQRISGYVEPCYIGDDMLRGMTDEVDAKILYGKHYGSVESVGFIDSDKWGFRIGYSPDGLIGDDGLIECKSRKHKLQIETILADEVPSEYIIQIQTGLLVSERKWCDFISFSAGLPMFTKRVMPDEKIQDAIVKAATAFEERIKDLLTVYGGKIKAPDGRFIPTERRIEQEISI